MSEVGPIRPEERFCEDRVAAYLRDRLPGLVGDGPIRFRQFYGGLANLTYLAQSGSTELVLRRPPLGPLAPRSHDMEREHRVLGSLHRAFPEAPHSFHLCCDPAVMGAPFVVMERRRGHVVRDAWPADLDDSARMRRRVAHDVVDTLARLHDVNVIEIGLGDLGRPEGFVERQIAGWAERWRRAAHEEVPAVDELVDRLQQSVPRPQSAVLLHNDYRLDNIMLGDDGSVAAVLDWDMATLGDPLVDLGTMLAYWAAPTDALSTLFGPHSFALSLVGRDEVVARYGAVSGFDTSCVHFYLAFGLFRIAVILQQIAIRFRRGQTSDSRFAALESVVPAIVEEALSALRDR